MLDEEIVSRWMASMLFQKAFNECSKINNPNPLKIKNLVEVMELALGYIEFLDTRFRKSLENFMVKGEDKKSLSDLINDCFQLHTDVPEQKENEYVKWKESDKEFWKDILFQEAEKSHHKEIEFEGKKLCIFLSYTNIVESFNLLKSDLITGQKKLFIQEKLEVSLKNFMDDNIEILKTFIGKNEDIKRFIKNYEKDQNFSILLYPFVKSKTEQIEGLYDIEQKILRIFINVKLPENTIPSLVHELFHRFDMDLAENSGSHKVLQDFLILHPELTKNDQLSILGYALEISGAAPYYMDAYREGKKELHQLSTEILANAISEYYDLTEKECRELLELKLLSVTKSGIIKPEPNLLLTFDLLQSLSQYFISHGLDFKVFNEFALGREKFEAIFESATLKMDQMLASAVKSNTAKYSEDEVKESDTIPPKKHKSNLEAESKKNTDLAPKASTAEDSEDEVEILSGPPTKQPAAKVEKTAKPSNKVSSPKAKQFKDKSSKHKLEHF